MNYNLNKQNLKNSKKSKTIRSVSKLIPIIKDEKKILILSLILILIGSTLSLISPLIIGRAVDKYIANGLYKEVVFTASILFLIYMVSLITTYLQTMLMGTVGQRLLYKLRGLVFQKLQSLPVAFFNQNKAGDLISRINNDTDKLNQFFSQSLVQFVSSIFIMIGAAIFLITIKPILGLAILAPALLILIFTRLISPWVRTKNKTNLTNMGGLSAEIQESLNNFKVVVAFNRRDYFRERFAESNQKNYLSAITAGIANNIFTPVYGFASNLGQLITLVFGIILISKGNLTIGLLISFISYTTNFYNPLRQIAALWANFQVAMAGWERISEILMLNSDLQIEEAQNKSKNKCILEFENVSFDYEDGKRVLNNISFCLEEGKTYALVGPTGGGKTTTASLMARLYDPAEGNIYLNHVDIKNYTDKERTQLIGFILQDPFLFKGTLKENLLLGNELYQNIDDEELSAILKNKGLNYIIEIFENGLETEIEKNNNLSLGQKQLIAFMRAILREPKILILDEATANIDTVTEQLLEKALELLPPTTTKVIIAHRLNTIENADTIFFVNNRAVVNAGTMQEAVEMLLNTSRNS